MEETTVTGSEKIETETNHSLFFASFSEIKFVLLELKICIIWNIGYAITKGRFWRCRARKK